MESIDNGKISFENEKINKDNLPEIQKKTGMIFQEFNLVNNLSAINNVLTGLLNSSSKFLSMFYLFTKEQKLEALKALKTDLQIKTSLRVSKSVNRNKDMRERSGEDIQISRFSNCLVLIHILNTRLKKTILLTTGYL